MELFSYDEHGVHAEYYEILRHLMQTWENEIVEFKEAKGQYSEEKIGQYFSAISNEANLKQQQYGWLILGVSEQQQKYVVGTAFKKGGTTLLEKLKYVISQSITDGMTFLDIIELYPVYQGKMLRVLMFKIPAAIAGMPTAWKNKYYARSGESLVPLSQYKIDTIRNQERQDWSKHILRGASIKNLDTKTIQLAREKYKEKMNRPHISEEIDSMSDVEFLTKMKLLIDGKVTNTAMLLLGNPDYDYLFPNAPVMMWRLYDDMGEVKDYEIFTIPFLTIADRIFNKIRNLMYRYMPNQLSLFPKETQQYDMWLLRELLNNCIAHSTYQLGGRIYVNESAESINFTNPGSFLPKSVESVLQTTYNPPFYRNQLLADAMVKFNMIDTATSGIKKVFRIQKNKYFPMPDYNFYNEKQVSVTVYGKILDERYTYMLFKHPELDLETVYLLDQVQKGNGKKLSKQSIQYLRKHKLVEGRINTLYVSAEVAHHLDEEAKYIKNRGFDDKYYKDLIIQFLQQYNKAKKADIRDLLWEKLPDTLTDIQKEYKITNLLAALKNKNIICKSSNNPQKSYWVLR